MELLVSIEKLKVFSICFGLTLMNIDCSNWKRKIHWIYFRMHYVVFGSIILGQNNWIYIWDGMSKLDGRIWIGHFWFCFSFRILIQKEILSKNDLGIFCSIYLCLSCSFQWECLSPNSKLRDRRLTQSILSGICSLYISPAHYWSNWMEFCCFLGLFFENSYETCCFSGYKRITGI